MSPLYYHPSGRFPLKALRYTLAALPLAISLGWLYAWLTTHLWVYLNVPVALAFSGVLVVICLVVSQAGKVRNALLMGLAGGFIGLVACYSQWAAWLAMQEPTHGAPGALELALHPAHMVQLALAVYQGGSWSIGGLPIGGLCLAPVWLIEFFLLAILPALPARSTSYFPICETSGTWAKEIKLPQTFAFVSDGAALIRALEANPAGLLDILDDKVADRARHSTLVLHRCAGSGLCYASVWNVDSSHGRTGESLRNVIKYLAIPAGVADAAQCQVAAPSAPAPPPTPPELAPALAALESADFSTALALALPYTEAPDQDLRNDARRMCALASARLGQWQQACDYWSALFEHAPSAHDALQMATCSVMKGDLARGQAWVARALDIAANKEAESGGDASAVLIHTNFITALKNSGHAKAALPYLDWLKKLYESLNITDPTFLQMHGLPFFSAFLEQSAAVIDAAMEPAQARAWYGSMRHHLDREGEEELNQWLRKRPASE
ncbi:tetratricopeptide (TPR) repeat protein [Oxalobacteraceae bacterium GrIS 1.11]